MSKATSADSARTTPPGVILFHSVLGLRPGVLRWAEQLRAAGYEVHTPDLCGGRVFDDFEPALRALEEMGGIEGLMERTIASVAELPSDVVYAGFSNGGGSAQLLALTRGGARGAILMHAALPVEVFGVTEWPADLPLQIHYAEDDPFRDAGAVEALQGAAARAGAPCAHWVYPGSGHLFADPDLPDFDQRSAALMFDRTLEFLRSL